jgi:serine/threonine protein phosphatase 1
MNTWIRTLRGLFAGREQPLTAPSRATIPDDTLVVAVGDVHGRIDLLEALWAQIRARAARSSCRRRVLVFLGDYVDRGPRSADVIERLVAGFDGFETVCLKGNHEETLLKFLQDPSVGDIWKDFGGLDTLRSYGISHAPGSSWADTRASFALVLPPAHLDFLKNLKLHHAEGDYLFVHAGVRPHVRLEDQQEYDLLWIRDEFLGSDASFGRVVVHGHTPTRDPVMRENRIGIDTGAFYSDKLTALMIEGRSLHLLST